MGTFHLLGLRIIREHRREPFAVCDRSEQVSILHELTGDRRYAERMAERMSMIKSLSGKADPEETQIWEAYENALASKGLYDFDDLILVPLRILEDDAAQAVCRRTFKYIMVDEFQDINPVQYKLTRRLADGGQNICAVGDADQAIYSFRGADVGNFLDFGRDFPGAKRLVLTRNYRSSKVILDAASSLIKHNMRRVDHELLAVKARGPKITVIEAPDEAEEARTIVSEIEAVMGGTSHYGLTKAVAATDFAEYSSGFRDFGVIFRTNTQAALMEHAFSESGIPYQIIRGKSPARAKEMSEILRGWIDDGPCIRSPGELADVLSRETGASPDEQAMLHQIAHAYGDLPSDEALQAIMNELMVLSSGDTFDPKAEAVTLMTLHAAKGLEFKVVFIAGVEDGMIPFVTAREEADVEEERRLFYVGMTRAKDDLFLTYARSRFLYGRRTTREPSRFLREIPEVFVARRAIPERRPHPRKRQGKLF